MKCFLSMSLVVLRSESLSGKCAKLHTVAASNSRDHSIIACLHHMYMGVNLHAHPVHGELRIQHHANWEVATISPLFYNKPYWLHVILVKIAPDITFTSWSRHHFAHTMAASNNRDHLVRSLCYCLFTPHIMGVNVCAHTVCSELHIQCHANWEVATVVITI